MGQAGAPCTAPLPHQRRGSGGRGDLGPPTSILRAAVRCRLVLLDAAQRNHASQSTGVSGSLIVPRT